MEDAGALFRLVDAHPTLSIVEIDNHLKKLNPQQQLRQLSYQHPSTNYNVLMRLMVEKTDNKALRISHNRHILVWK